MSRTVTIAKISAAALGCALLLVCAASPAAAQKTLEEAKQVAAYPLTMDNVTRYLQTSAEVRKKCTTDPDLARRFQEYGSTSHSLDESLKWFKATPKLLAASKEHGISAHDMVMTQAAFLAAIQVGAALENGTKEAPTDPESQILWASVSHDHLKLLNDHAAEIAKLQAALAQAQPEK